MTRFASRLLPLLLLPLLGGCLTRGDSVAPIVTINDPPSGAARSLANATVCGYALDDEGIAAIRVGNSDLLANAAYAGERGKRLVQFCFAIDRQAGGEFSSTIVVEDVQGRVTTEVYTLQIDTTPPTLELRSVTRTPEGRLRVAGVARDNDMVRTITVAGQTIAFSPTPEKEFNVDVAAEPGAIIVVEDRAGNSYSQPLEP